MTMVNKYRFVLVLVFFTIRPLLSFGSDSKPCFRFHFNTVSEMNPVIDTIPEAKKPAETNTDNTGPEETKTNDIKPVVIKQVPKSRKQVKPIALPPVVPVKPIKIIKPKIIRSVTGFIH